MTPGATYTTLEVMRLTGATYRQLTWWRREGYVEGLRRGVGTGSPVVWNEAQVTRVRSLVRASDFVYRSGGRTPRTLADVADDLDALVGPVDADA